MKKKVPYIEQMEHSECGLACLGMVLGYHGRRIGLPELRDMFGTSPKGSSLMDLIKMGEKFQLDGKAYKAEVSHFGELPLPAVLFWDHKHYVVLEHIGRRHFTIVDPSHGRRKLRYDEFIAHYSGIVLTLTPGSSFIPARRERKVNFLLSHVLKQKKLLSGILLAGFFLQGVGLVVPQLTRWVVDRVLLPGNQGYIAIIGMSVLGLYLFHQAFSLLRGYLIARLQTVLDMSLMSAFIAKLFSLPYMFFESRTSGDLIFRANSNVMIRQILSSRVISLVIDFLLIIGYAAMMLYMDRRMALVVVGLSVVVLVVLLISSRLVKRLSDRSVASQSKTQSYLTENITGITDIKVLGLENKVFRQWKELFQGQLHAAEKQSLLSAALDSFSSGMYFIIPLLLLWLGSGMVVSGELTVGQLMGFSALASQFMMPIISLSLTYTQFLALGAYVHRLQDVMDSKSEQLDGFRPHDMECELELRDVSFKYDFFGDPVLSGINLTIAPGETVAIVGESGSGKSTLARLLLGLFTPSGGSILFGGIPMDRVDLAYWRSHVGAVLQETRMFHGSVMENIQLLDDNVSMQEVVHAAALADIHDEIMQQPMGYFTMVSEAGSNFSGGQRQRLLLARALVSRPRILILDEATSALDNLSEARIQANLKALHCTQIIIAHRLSTVVQADRIVVLNKGTIHEYGSHHELMSKRGLYYRLYTAEKENRNEEVAI
ncbi:peptidase domain-containing ABC transporter [Paenibacillus xerothermodurans]|uniref:Peptidase domain-containing ABC transporter n=1 Tax=Paenibacillus xerothermodurans TaxID=1977292 RepID=A0A2W1N6L8_PAEXE|nr:peptidase domain-containing ABC transporter [Paenibacillus xerothermodurans]PZE20047.1 peptidase domain-containing ABC transporter [Paenibacillus xerothermodurans]